MGVQNDAASVASSRHCPGPLPAKIRSRAPAEGSGKGPPSAGSIDDAKAMRRAVALVGATSRMDLPATGTSRAAASWNDTATASTTSEPSAPRMAQASHRGRPRVKANRGAA